MPLKMRVICNKEFHATATRWRYRSPEIVGSTLSSVILKLQKTAIAKAQNQLKLYVYQAPLPPSAEGNAAHYLEVKRRRTGQLFKAIKKSEIKKINTHTYAGEVYVADSGAGAALSPDSTHYYYARILEYGGRTINYKPVMFWRVTKTQMAAEMRRVGPVIFTYTKGALKGHPVGGSAGSGIFNIV